MKDKELRQALLETGLVEYDCFSDGMWIRGFRTAVCRKKIKGVQPFNYDNDISDLRTKMLELKSMFFTTPNKSSQQLADLTKRIETLEQKKKR